ncbi:metallophosphoesterase, partial [archaeon CG_4_10_14_0_2_um_filter_Archaea_38_6]
MKFVQGEAAIKSGNYIVISDVHIGFEEKLEEKGYTIPEQTQNVTDRLKELRKIAENLIILGDLKHSINIR